MRDYKQVMMETAYVWSKMSYCKRRQVGAVIERDGHILDTGYNGTIAGTDNNCEEDLFECPFCGQTSNDINELVVFDKNYYQSVQYMDRVKEIYCKHCHKRVGTVVRDKIRDKQIKHTLVTNDFTVHAEQNIIANCAKEGISLKGATMYITTSPCKMCAKLIASVGIKQVFFSEEYKDQAGVKYLNDLGIKTEQYILEGSHFFIDPSKCNKDK